jgi:hypothetical protein
VALASLVLFAIAWGGGRLLLADWAAQTFWPKLASLTLVIGCAAVAFFLCASALGIGEVRELAGAVRRRLRRGR